MGTKIEWCEETWNPIVGCSRISEGCRNCYAERMAYRLAAMDREGYNDGVVRGVGYIERPGRQPRMHGEWTGQTRLIRHVLDKPFGWQKPRRIFVCSMGDIFHESVTPEMLLPVFETMAWAKQHTFLVLTKRPERIKPMLYPDLSDVHTAEHSRLSRTMPLPNVWLGVTVENQPRADERIPVLMDLPAARRFVSVEPMLGPIRMGRSVKVNGGGVGSCPCSPPSFHDENWLSGYQGTSDYKGRGAGYCKGPRLDWVICGAETGPCRRQMLQSWADDLYAQCRQSGVPFFGKKDSAGRPLTVDGGRVVREWPND